jgi:DNA-binding MarR family transcriptional regulator
MTTRWLTPEEQRAWRAYVAGYLLVEDAIDRQLQQEAGMPHLYYSILANLSDTPERRLRMTELAEQLKITRSRLTYAVTRLEKDGLLRREDCSWDKRGSVAVLTDEGMAVLEKTAPGHVDTVRASLFARLTPEQVGQLEDIFTQVVRGFQGGDSNEAAPEDLPWRRRSSPCSGSTGVFEGSDASGGHEASEDTEASGSPQASPGSPRTSEGS